MGSYGQYVVGEFDGNTTQVLADGHDADWKSGGGTFDWSLVTAPTEDVELPDGQVIPAGVKYIRYGEILAEIHRAEIQTVTRSATPDAGTQTFGVTRNGVTHTTPALAYNASAATVRAALEALDNVGAGNIAVALNTNVFTFTFQGALANEQVADIIANSSLTASGNPVTLTVATTSQGTGDQTGKIGPHRTNATDGRQTLEAGLCWVSNRTVREDDPVSDHAFELFDGGRIWEARLKVGGANEATLAQVKAAFPRLSYAR
jgi:hypothetical protein